MTVITFVVMPKGLSVVGTIVPVARVVRVALFVPKSFSALLRLEPVGQGGVRRGGVE